MEGQGAVWKNCILSKVPRALRLLPNDSLKAHNGFCKGKLGAVQLRGPSPQGIEAESLPVKKKETFLHSLFNAKNNLFRFHVALSCGNS